MATAATFIVQVPAGAGPGSVLALTAPNGVQVQVQVPAGLATGATFAVGMPAPPVAVMAAPVVAQVAMQPVMMNQVGQPQQMGQRTMLVGAAQQSGGGMGLGLSMVNTHSVAPSSQYGVGARTTFEIERDLFHMGGVIAEAYGVDVPDKYIIREWMPTGEVRQTCALLSVLSV